MPYHSISIVLFGVTVRQLCCPSDTHIAKLCTFVYFVNIYLYIHNISFLILCLTIWVLFWNAQTVLSSYDLWNSSHKYHSQFSNGKESMQFSLQALCAHFYLIVFLHLFYYYLDTNIWLFSNSKESMQFSLQALCAHFNIIILIFYLFYYLNIIILISLFYYFQKARSMQFSLQALCAHFNICSAH